MLEFLWVNLDGNHEPSTLKNGWPVLAGGWLRPGGGLARFLEAVRQRRLRGIVALGLDEPSVVRWPAELRAKVGALLQEAPVVYAVDELSREWCAHYGLKAESELCPDLAWAWSVWSMTTDIGQAIACAKEGRPCPLDVRRAVTTAEREYHPLVRFAHQFGCEAALAFDEDRWEYLRKNPPPPVDAALVARAAEQVKRITSRLTSTEPQTRTVTAKVATMLGKPAPRRLEGVFDPSTHYTHHYYDGTGLEYQRPDGSWDIYYGPGLSWDGNEVVLNAFEALGMTKGACLDVGCSGGDFVLRAWRRGIDAYGVDISEAALERANPEVRPRLLLGDITKTAVGERVYSLVTAFDLLEHIWLHDVDVLIGGFKRQLAPGGFGAFIICTRGDNEADWTIEPGTEYTPENSWLLCSGHVTIRPWGWWARKFSEHGFVIRFDLAYLFQVRRSEHPLFKQAESWSPRNFLVVEKRA